MVFEKDYIKRLIESMGIFSAAWEIRWTTRNTTVCWTSAAGRTAD